MVYRSTLKSNVQVSSSQIINFLKQKKLYHTDNGIENISTNIASLNDSNQSSISWVSNTLLDLKDLNSNILIVPKEFSNNFQDRSIIFTHNPKLAIVLIINNFFMDFSTKTYIHPSAQIDESAKIGNNCIINENVVIGANSVIGDNVTIYPNVTIFNDTIISDNCVINANCSIGQEGFGYIKDLEEEYIQFPHLGRVIIKENVEIGANCSIDRGALSDTIIGHSTKIGNHCIITHNVQIGTNCLLPGKVGISGSATIGNNVYLGADCGISNCVTIGDNAIIGEFAFIRKDVPANKMMVSLSAFEKRDYVKVMKRLKS